MSGFIDGPVLGIETTGTLTGAALFREGRLVAESSVDIRAGSAERLLEIIQGQLRAHDLDVSDLARIGVAQGPGSFTGLRVGLAAARGLGWGADVPLVAVPSHQALAWPWRDLGRTLVILTGARRGQVFFEAGRWGGDWWQVRREAASIPLAEAADEVVRLPESGRLLFTGEAVEAVCELHPRLCALGSRVHDGAGASRRPAAVAALAARREALELRGPELDRLEPLYLRAADARLPGTTG